MQTGTPPYVPIRHERWPTRRMPRWLIAGLAGVIAAGVLIGIAVHPSRAQRATDLNGFLHDMKVDLGSCAAGLGDSLGALRAIEAGTRHDVSTAVGTASFGANNCSPANSMPLDDLVSYQVQESLAGFHLDRAVNGLLTWAFPDAQRVMADIVAVLHSSGTARAAASTKLQHDLHALDGQRAYVMGIVTPAIRATGATGRLLTLPG
jgi:hypothetical protein